MKTVAEVMEWYNKSKSKRYHKITVSEPALGNFSFLEFTDVSSVMKTNKILSFYGRAIPNQTYDSHVPKQSEIRFTRINNGKIIYSEV